MHSSSNASFNELQWLSQIRKILEDELEDDDGIAVSISNAPKPLLSSKPDCYAPQLVALGPYHHTRRELHEMERYKLSAAKKACRHLSGSSFQSIIQLFVKLEYPIRGHYHRYLDFNGETLAWMMAIDAMFMIEYLQIYLKDDNGRSSEARVPPRMKLAHDLIPQDMMKLENQIPLFLLRKILEFTHSSSKFGDEMLASMLIGFLKEISPLKLVQISACMDLSQHSHLLELLYHSVVPEFKQECEAIDADHMIEQISEEKSGDVVDLVSTRCGALLMTVIKFLVKIPWRIITKSPVFLIIKQPVEHLLFSHMHQPSKTDEPTKIHGNKTSPLLEEIAIPSVTELAGAGIRFSPTNGGLSTIEFNTRTGTLRLPAVDIDVNSEVVLRNLVAYESAIVSGPLVFTRYIELMNGIIDTIEDVRILREIGVVSNRLKSDGEAVDLWNGMSRSLRLTRARELDKIIEEVNKYYSSSWRVKLRKLVKRHVIGSWQHSVVAAVVLFLLVTSVQTFRLIYGCAR